MASLEVLLTRGQIVLDSKPPRNPAWLNRIEVAERVLDRALADARDRSSRHGLAQLSWLHSELAYRRGVLPDVEAHAQTALTITSPSEMLAGGALAAAMMISALLERGAVDAAADVVATIGLSDAELPLQAPFNLLLGARARLRMACGDLAGGLDDLHECGRRHQLLEFHNPVLAPWRIDAASAHHARGELDAAWALADEELNVARDWGTPGPIGAATRLAGLLTTGDEGIALLREAERTLAGSPARLEHARTLVDLGAALRRSGCRREARETLKAGLDMAHVCGAGVLSARAREELTAAGARPRRERLRGPEALTASERRVAELAADGLTNREIAQALFVTTKTIETHLARAYAKLDIISRGDLTVALHYFKAAAPQRTPAIEGSSRRAPARTQT